MKKIIILGGLGNGSVIANAIVDAQKRGCTDYEFCGYLNDRETEIQGWPVLGKVSQAPEFVSKGYYFINTIYRIDGKLERIKKFEDLKIPQDRLATFIHPMAYVAPQVNLSPGCVIMPQVCVNSGVSLGVGCLIMIAATIGHDTSMGKYCHVAAQAVVGSYLQIKDAVHVGQHSTIREGLTIGPYSAIGQHSNVLKNIGEGEIWIGNPAKLHRLAR